MPPKPPKRWWVLNTRLSPCRAWYSDIYIYIFIYTAEASWIIVIIIIIISIMVDKCRKWSTNVRCTNYPQTPCLLSRHLKMLREPSKMAASVSIKEWEGIENFSTAFCDNLMSASSLNPCSIFNCSYGFNLRDLIIRNLIMLCFFPHF